MQEPAMSDVRTVVLSNLALYIFPAMMRVPARRKGEKELRFLGQ